jgi:hypothetical protein
LLRIADGDLFPTAEAPELAVGTKVAPPFALKAEDGTWHGIRRFSDDTLYSAVSFVSVAALDPG